LIAASSQDRASLRLMGAGIASVLVFNLPFVLVSKREQYHLLALGAVISYTGALWAIFKVQRHICAIALVAVLVPAMVSGTQQNADFGPCGTMVLDGDADVAGWWVVPSEVKQWLVEKREACLAGTPVRSLVTLPIIWWNAHDSDGASEAPRWLSDWAVAIVPRTTRRLTLALRREDATANRPVHITIGAGRETPVVLNSPEWKFVTLNFRDRILDWVRDGRPLIVKTSEWYVPAAVDPTSRDLQRYGVQVRVVDDHQ